MPRSSIWRAASQASYVGRENRSTSSMRPMPVHVVHATSGTTTSQGRRADPDDEGDQGQARQPPSEARVKVP